MPPQALILRAPGTNCDEETAYAFARAGAIARRVHVNRLIEQPTIMDAFQIFCIPGGFSFGDDIAAGRILASQIGHHLGDRLQQFRDDGKLILGICNGFQVMLKLGILLAPNAAGPRATLAWNDSGKFEDRWVALRACGTACVFLTGIEQLRLPVAHAEGKFVTRDDSVLTDLDAAGQLVLRYQSHGQDDAGPVAYPDNPNGSMGNVAGLCDPTGRVFGMMPHPERFIDATHDAQWSRNRLGSTAGAGDGLRIFENAVQRFA